MSGGVAIDFLSLTDRLFGTSLQRERELAHLDDPDRAAAEELRGRLWNMFRDAHLAGIRREDLRLLLGREPMGILVDYGLEAAARTESPWVSGGDLHFRGVRCIETSKRDGIELVQVLPGRWRRLDDG